LIGHTLKEPNTNITHQALTWNEQRKRKTGRSKSTSRRDLDLDLREMAYSWIQIETIAQERSRWKALVGGLYSDRGCERLMMLSISLLGRYIPMSLGWP